MAKPNQNDSKLVDQSGNVVAEIKASPYGDCEISRPDNADVYPAQRGGGKSTQALRISLPVLSCGLTLPINVYMRMDGEGKIKIDPSLPKGIRVTDDQRDVFKQHVNRAINKWSGTQRAFTEAHARLLAGPKAKTAKADKADDTEIAWVPPVVPAPPATETANAAPTA